MVQKDLAPSRAPQNYFISLYFLISFKMFRESADIFTV